MPARARPSAPATARAFAPQRRFLPRRHCKIAGAFGAAFGVVLALASSDVASQPAGLPATTGANPSIVAADPVPRESEARRAAAATTAASPKLFFGFLEFDHDSDAPGGVPGFGPLPSPIPQFTTAETRR
jgi:hypothetical protein